MVKPNLNQKTIEWLKQNPDIGKLYTIFGEEKAGAVIFTPVMDRPFENKYIDGSFRRAFTIALNTFQTISRHTVDSVAPEITQNIEKFFKVENIIEWIEEQHESHNFPDFTPYEIEEIQILARNPNMAGQSLELVRYMCQFRILYMDYTKIGR